jgi:hypothetical protein
MQSLGSVGCPLALIRGRPTPHYERLCINPGATIVTVDDLWVDPISTAPDFDAVSIIDVNATLIPSLIVSQCH